MARSRPALHPRHKIACIASRLQLMLFRMGRPRYARKGHLVDVFPDLYLAMVVLENDDRNRHGPLSLNKLYKLTGISRGAIRERTKALVRHGIIKHAGRDGGYVGNPDYFARGPAKFYAQLRAVIRAANSETTKVKVV
jgi:biotin operon repressor